MYAFGIGSYLSPETGTRINGNREGLSFELQGRSLRRWSKGEAFAFDPNRGKGERARKGREEGS